MLVCDRLNGEGIMGVGLARMRLVADLVLPQSGCGASETESVTDVGERGNSTTTSKNLIFTI